MGFWLFMTGCNLILPILMVVPWVKWEIELKTTNFIVFSSITPFFSGQRHTGEPGLKNKICLQDGFCWLSNCQQYHFKYAKCHNKEIYAFSINIQIYS